MAVTNRVSTEDRVIRLHLTNVQGLGAVRLIQSLLPSFCSQNKFRVEQVYVPDNKNIIDMSLFGERTKVSIYRRYLPRSISRLLECTFFGGIFSGRTPLLVLGDMPLRCSTKQVVFLQNMLLLEESNYGNKFGFVKYWILRSIFKRNLKYVDSFIVQTVAMKDQLIKLYPNFNERVHVIAQPVPEWLIESKLQRTESQFDNKKGIRLFYPAAFYPHKNHKLLAGIDIDDGIWPIDTLTLTIPEISNPMPKVKWIQCKGTLTPQLVLDEYRKADALLFLSYTESYGFPLIEAMWMGLPIICPDLTYARNLCGKQAVYFSPSSLKSLYSAINELSDRLQSGWWPDWSAELTLIPRDWESVAKRMAEVSFLNR